jgi:hypothetical protein
MTKVWKPKCERCRDTGWVNTSPTKAWPDPVPCGCAADRGGPCDYAGGPEPKPKTYVSTADQCGPGAYSNEYD